MQYPFLIQIIIFNDLDNCNTLIFLQFFLVREWMNEQWTQCLLQYIYKLNFFIFLSLKDSNNYYGNGVGSNKKKKRKGERTNYRHEEKGR
jgi:hypothetical protein